MLFAIVLGVFICAETVVAAAAALGLITVDLTTPLGNCRLTAAEAVEYTLDFSDTRDS
jgi:hypothetical protein